MKTYVSAAALLAGLLGGLKWAPGDGFPHLKHNDLFPSCVTCHQGAVDSAVSLWPSPEGCVSCHDGSLEDVVVWEPPPNLPATNLAFTHRKHRESADDDDIDCVSCHAGPEAEWMDVLLTSQEQCMSCHDIDVHLDAPDSTCTACHLTLARATRIDTNAIAGFPEPESHQADDFSGGNHWPDGEPAVGSCSVCHAREFCLQCHVDGPEVEQIVRLESADRSLVLSAQLTAPSSHSEHDFVTGHGLMANRENCATCHTRESCVNCHRARPEVAREMYPADARRAVGARTERHELPSHSATWFQDNHGVDASAAPQTCAGCHVREDCLDCHAPDVARSSSYHEADFLVRHPAAAFNRETSCANCHSSRTFCTACHAQAGLVADGRFASGYHDGSRLFSLGHGQAARQTLETCVTCHTERDCASCHSAQTGRRLNPHGPGFDAERLKRRSPEMCTACHGTRVPG